MLSIWLFVALPLSVCGIHINISNTYIHNSYIHINVSNTYIHNSYIHINVSNTYIHNSYIDVRHLDICGSPLICMWYDIWPALGR
jgi:hypothetical protein